MPVGSQLQWPKGRPRKEATDISCEKPSPQKPRHGHEEMGLLCLLFHKLESSLLHVARGSAALAWGQLEPGQRPLGPPPPSMFRASQVCEPWGFWHPRTGSLCSSRPPAAQTGRSVSLHLPPGAGAGRHGAVQSHRSPGLGAWVQVPYPYPFTLLEGRQAQREVTAGGTRKWPRHAAFLRCPPRVVWSRTGRALWPALTLLGEEALETFRQMRPL